MPDAVGVPGVVGAWVSVVPPPVVTENELTARPVCPTHGSKPAWMLVRYQARWANPRLIASLKKSLTVKLAEVVVCCRTYDTTFQPMLPAHTFHVAPAMLAVPTTVPTGWMVPVCLSHSRIS